MSRYKWILRNTKTNAVFELRKDPKGWQQLTVKRYRSEDFHGIFMEPSAKELSFLRNGGGKEFIDAIYATDDVNAKIELTCKIAYNGAYRNLFVAKLNLAKWSTTSDTTTVNLEQSDLYHKILSRKDISVNLESTTSIGGATITAPATRQIELPGQDIYLESRMNLMAPRTATFPFSQQTSFQNSGYFTHQFQTQNSELDYFQGSADFTEYGYPGVTEDTSNVPPIYEALSNLLDLPDYFNIKVRVKGVFTDYMPSFQTRTNFAVTLVLAYGKDFASATKVTMQAIGGYTSMVTTHTENFDVNYTGTVYLNLGDKVWLTWFVQETLTTGAGYHDIEFSWDYELADVQIDIESSVAPTETKAMMLHEAFNQIVDSIADSDGNFRSDFYGRPDSEKQTYGSRGEQSMIAITGGKNIRLFDEPLIESLERLFTSAKALHNIGMGIYEGKVRVEPLSFFYQSNRILTLKYVPGFTTTNDNSRYYNQILVGYEKWESEFKGGLREVNTKHEYSTVIDSIKNVLNIFSPIIASAFALELTRRKNKNRLQTTDWKYDNDNFWIALNQGLPGYVVDAYNLFIGGAYSGKSELYSEYNIRLSPARMLLAHFNKIAAGLQKVQGQIAFITGQGNTAMSVIKNASGNRQEDYNFQPLAENQSFDFDDANVKNRTPLWVPEIYEFQYALTAEEETAIDANPYGFIDFFETPADIRSGYILEQEYIFENSKTNFKLLRRYGN